MAFLEGESVKFSGGKENAVENHVIQFVVGAQLRFVEVVTRLAHFLRIKIPVPGRDLEPTVFLVDNLLRLGRFTFGVSDCRRRELAQKFVHGGDIFRGLVFELIGGVIFVAEKFGALGAKLGRAQNDLAGIKLAAFTVAPERRPYNALTQLSILQRPEQWLPRRVLHLNDELAVLVLGLRRVGNGCHLAVRKTGELFLAIDHDRRRVLFLENVLFELRLQCRQLGIDLLQLFLVRIRQLGAGAHEILVVTLEEIGGFRIEAEFVAAVVKLLDPREQFAVEMDCVAMGRQLWRHFLFDLLQRWIRVAGVKV